MSLTEKLRKQQGTRTDAQMAESLGLPLRTYANWKYGYRKPRGYTLAMLLQKLKEQKAA